MDEQPTWWDSRAMTRTEEVMYIALAATGALPRTWNERIRLHEEAHKADAAQGGLLPWCPCRFWLTPSADG